MKVVGIALALAIAGALLYWFVLRNQPVPPPGTQSPIAAGSGSAAIAPAPSSPTKTKAIDSVRRVTKEERAQLAAQIQHAKQGRAGSAGSQAGGAREVPTLEAGSDEVLVKTTMRAAMRELIPMLAECYEADDKLPAMLEVVADLQLTGDPDIGTIVDAKGLKNKDGTPADAAFATCVQDTLVTLAMPPLSEGGEVQVTYPFMFSRRDSTMPQ